MPPGCTAAAAWWWRMPAGWEESYGKLIKTALALGRIAAKMTVEGERVGVLMPNLNATAALLFGLPAMRRVPAMLNYTAGLEGMQAALPAGGSAGGAHLARVPGKGPPYRDGGETGGRAAGLPGGRARGIRPGCDKAWLIAAMLFPRRAVGAR